MIWLSRFSILTGKNNPQHPLGEDCGRKVGRVRFLSDYQRSVANHEVVPSGLRKTVASYRSFTCEKESAGDGGLFCVKLS